MIDETNDVDMRADARARPAPGRNGSPLPSTKRAPNELPSSTHRAATSDRSAAKEAASPRKRLAAMAITFFLTLCAAELTVRATPPQWAVEGSVTHRAPNVVALPRHMDNLPPPVKTRPQLLLVGTSQAYGIGGKHRGDEAVMDGDGTTIDELASHIGIPDAQYYRLADSGLLPFEQLVAVERLYQRGYDPKVVVIAWPWTLFARDRNVRPWVHGLFRDAEFVTLLESVLAAHNANDEVVKTVRKQRSLAATESDRELRLSTADRADRSITNWGGDHIALIGQSSDIRSRFYMAIVERGLAKLTGGNVNAVREVVEADLDFNLDCMRVLVEDLASHGAVTLAYLLPLRTDLPQPTDDTRLDEVMGGLAQRLAPFGLTMVDARHVVPNEEFGWFDDYPDKAHFSLKGHALMGAFLAESLKRHQLLAPLSAR